ncbi:hypothetical protein [Avibacterium paragallinarum]|uniref:hypothetical protein n=1 Tax=Avibacterium paragallinarum TaxID=728 RepID=UPI001C9A10AD|nr:hypothetical protein [Avibacterium paragallinarum]QZP15562.1 hypothetical protein K5O18_12525 [Avibacterium paragallinarum]
MKSFTLVLTATFDFCDDDGVNDVGLKWSSTDGKALSDAPTELEPVIAELMRHSNYALPILSPLFEEFSQNNEPVTATASVKLKEKKNI